MARSNTLSHAFRLATMRGLALIFGVLFLKAVKASAGQVLPVPEGDISWSSAFVGTLFMIICSELGDKVKEHQKQPVSP